MKIDEIGEITMLDGRTEDFYVHFEGKDATRVEAAADATVEEILRQAGVVVTPDQHVFLGECVDSLTLIEIEDGEDRHEPVPHHHSPHHHGYHGGHIHCHTCRRIKVIVTYNGNEKHHRFSPATTIETVLAWTAKKFGITPVDAEKLVLKLSDAEKPLKPDAHLGDLLRGHTHCSITMELVPDHGRVNG